MTELETAILEQLKADTVSFGTLARIAGFAGDKWLTLVNYSTVVLWLVGAEAGTILQRLGRAGHLHYEPTDLRTYYPPNDLTYLVDSSHLPKLPLATQARQYKTQHWLPVVLRPGPGAATAATFGTYCVGLEQGSAYPGGNVIGLWHELHENRQRLLGLTHAEHKFCAAAVAQIQHTCVSSDLLRDRTIGPRLKKLMRQTEKLRRCLERHCEGYGYYGTEQNVALGWVELRKTLNAVNITISGKVSAKVINAWVDVWEATNMTVYKLQERRLINDIDWKLFLAAWPAR